MGCTPVLAPMTVVRVIRVDVTVWVVAFDVGEIKEDFPVVFTVFTDLLVSSLEIGLRPRPIVVVVKVSGHVDKSHRRIVILQPIHRCEIRVDSGLCVVADPSAPRPHHDIDTAVCIERRSGGIDPPLVAVVS